MPIRAKLRSFARKDRAQKAAAVRSAVRRLALRRVMRGGLAAPKVLHSGSRWYVAYRPDWDVEFDRFPELRDLSDRWVAHNVDNNAGDLPRMYALLLNIRQVMEADVPGDFAELGVYRGNSAAVLAHYGRLHGRSVFLFDTYEGFSRQDLAGIDAGKPRMFADTSLDLVKRNVGADAAVYVRGFFPGTVTDDIAGRRFAVVHLDCDLYEPMKAGMEFFFPRLSPGGLLVMHDYANPYWDGAKRAVDEYVQGIGESLVLIPDKSGTAMLRKSR